MTGLEGAGKSATWDGEIDFTPLSTLRLRARGLDPVVEASAAEEPVKAETKRTSTKKAAKVDPETVVDGGVVDEQIAAEAPAAEAEAPAPVKKPAPKKAAADVVDEQSAAEEPAPKARKTPAPKADPES